MNIDGLKCGSCEGCWYKTNHIIPDNIDYGCPCYHQFEPKIGKEITVEHWSQGDLISGTIIGMGSGAITIEINDFGCDPELPKRIYPDLKNLPYYMEQAYIKTLSRLESPKNSAGRS